MKTEIEAIIRSDFKYHSDGKLFYAVSRRGIKLGGRAGTWGSNKYRHVRILNKSFSEHQIIWFIHTGEWSTRALNIDHINGDKTDNRIENLRICSNSENQQNRHTHRKGSPIGVTKHSSGKWQAVRPIIWQGFDFGKRKYLGLFTLRSEAAAAVMESLK